jgi:RHS repeat-associated protein
LATVSYGYSPGGAVTSEDDSQAGTLTATYNPGGQLATESYPGGITATYTYDATGTATSVSYDGPDWTSPLTDTIVPNAHSDWTSQAITDTSQSLVASQNYGYDSADRLASVQDTQNGQCTTRDYGYDTDSNRTSLTSYAPAADGSCQSSTGTTESYSYDSADRLISSGYAYDTQGDIVTIPSTDAGGNGNLAETYYANDMLASQTLAGSTDTWVLDPELNRYATWTSSASGLTFTNHYSSNSASPTWVSASNGSWTRTVTGVNGLLAATVTPSGTTLQLVDLHGDVMATAAASPASTGPTAIYLYSEFGASEHGSPGTYGWLGGYAISSATLGNTLLMGARAYSAPDGRFDQVDPMPGGSANAYDYAAQQPLNNADLSGTHYLHVFHHWSWSWYSWTWTFYWSVYLGWYWTEYYAAYGTGATALVSAIAAGIAWWAAAAVLAYYGWIAATAVWAVETDRCLYIYFVWDWAYRWGTFRGSWCGAP